MCEVRTIWSTHFLIGLLVFFDAAEAGATFHSDIWLFLVCLEIMMLDFDDSREKKEVKMQWRRWYLKKKANLMGIFFCTFHRMMRAIVEGERGGRER